MSTLSLEVKAEWDPEACVWVAVSEDILGLATEADTLESLIEKLRVIIPELMQANGLITPDQHVEIPFHLLSKREEKAYV